MVFSLMDHDQNETGIIFQFFKAFAAELDDGPRHHLRVAVFAHHVGRNGFMVKAGLLGNGTYQSRRVKTRPRPKNMARRQTAQFGNEIGHHITGIGDVDEDSLEAPLHDLGNEVSNLSHRKVHFRIPVMGNQQINFPNGIDDDIAVAQFFIGSHGHT